MTAKPMRIEITNCRARLPAAVWRALARTERPAWRPDDCAAVAVDDAGETVYVLSSRRYHQLMHYLNALERDEVA